MANEFPELIMDGGNGGLAIATGLKKASIAYAVFERDNEYDLLHKARDWGILLQWATEYLENVLPDHLRKRIKEPIVDPACEMADRPLPYFNGATGEIIGLVPTDVITGVSRKKLRKFLTQGENPDVEVSFLISPCRNLVDSDVTADFEDGSSAYGSMVIGVDGLTTINYAGAHYTPEQAQVLQSFHPIVQLSVHPTERMSALLAALDIPDSNDTTDWKLQNYTSWWGPPFAADLKDPAVRLQHMKKRMSHFQDTFRTGWLSLSDEVILPVYPGQQWAPTMSWNNRGGRVTLAGDAAHSMLPHRVQGLNNAMKDASDLVDAIKAAVSDSVSLEDASTGYEEETRPRGAKEVALSLEQAENSRDWARFMSSPIFKFEHYQTASD